MLDDGTFFIYNLLDLDLDIDEIWMKAQYHDPFSNISVSMYDPCVYAQEPHLDWSSHLKGQWDNDNSRLALWRKFAIYVCIYIYGKLSFLDSCPLKSIWKFDFNHAEKRCRATNAIYFNSWADSTFIAYLAVYEEDKLIKGNIEN